MAANHSPFDYQFERLMQADEGGGGETHPLFIELLRHGHTLADPLAEFLLRQKEGPRLAILVNLLGKCMDGRAANVLIHFLKSGEPALRRAAANALGWNRSRAGLEMLDRVEGNDPDPAVREEARAAIEEILREFPNLASLLKHHKPLPPPEARISGEHDLGAPDQPDDHQRLKLMAALPRLLAVKYNALPLHFSPGSQLHMAVNSGSERRLMATLSQLTGYHVQLHPWPPERIRNALETFYTLGDDDFCTFHDRLQPMAREEVVEAVLAGVRTDEPMCPLDESNDAAEAVQSFLSCLVAQDAADFHISYEPPHMVLLGHTRSGGALELGPPEENHRERFLTALRLLAGLDARTGLGQQKGGRIHCHQCDPPATFAVRAEKHLSSEAIEMEREAESP